MAKIKFIEQGKRSPNKKKFKRTKKVHKWLNTIILILLIIYIVKDLTNI